MRCFYYSLQRIEGCGCHYWIIDRVDNRLEDGQSFDHFHRRRVRNINYVFVPHLELCSKKIAGRVSKVHIINHWDDRALELGTIDTKLLCNLPRLTSVEEDRCGVGSKIPQAAYFGHRLCKRKPPSVKGDLTLAARSAASRCR